MNLLHYVSCLVRRLIHTRTLCVVGGGGMVSTGRGGGGGGEARPQKKFKEIGVIWWPEKLPEQPISAHLRDKKPGGRGSRGGAPGKL